MASKNTDKKKIKKRRKEQNITYDSDDVFAFIAGYTSGGFPYSVTWEEMGQKAEIDPDEELPFI